MSYIRGYITLAQAQAVEATATEAMVDLAEQIIDDYVKFQDSHVKTSVFGIATSGSTTTIVDTSTDSVLDDYEDDYFKNCVAQIVGGTNEGEIRRITSSDKSNGSVTLSSAFSSAIDATSAYKVYQLSKFPRNEDVVYDNDTAKYYKSIPEEVKQAVLAQISYIVEKGDSFFEGQTDITSESLGRWSASYGKENLSRLVSPKARGYLQGIRNIKGTILNDARVW